MIIVKPGLPFSFNYGTFDYNSGLDVRSKIYDISSGTPVFVSNVNLHVQPNGLYSGQFIAVSLKTYLVITFVYTDNTYTTIDTSRAPACEIYKSFDADTTLMAFTYGAFDFESGLFIGGNIYDSTAGFPSVLKTQIQMEEVLGGIYFGSYLGESDHVYEINMVPYTDPDYSIIDTDRAPGDDNVQLFRYKQDITVENIFQAAKLIGQWTDPNSPSQPSIDITQGDDAVLTFIATNGHGEAIDLTGATLETFLRDAQGNKIIYGNGQHTINPDQSAFKGYFTLALTHTQTDDIPEGDLKEVVTLVTQNSNDIYFHGKGLLNVLSSTPIQ